MYAPVLIKLLYAFTGIYLKPCVSLTPVNPCMAGIQVFVVYMCVGSV